MIGCRTAIRAGCCALVLAWVVGCGGATTHSDDEPDSGGTSAKPPNGGGYANGGSSGTAGTRSTAGAAGKPIKDPLPVNTACPPEELPPPSLECDAYSSSSTCGAGLGCYPFVEHPDGRGCDAQVYGTICLPGGVGTQGVVCGDDTGDICAPGFVCVVGQLAGKRCAALCDPVGENTCTGGLICGDLDVAGFGVCG
ncbi:MAG TPA: hypothetical protein VJN18_31190 [Polyangiaceae bacterium]|nr:hypothetical protein [Polyangiaceae bacterium]